MNAQESLLSTDILWAEGIEWLCIDIGQARRARAVFNSGKRTSASNKLIYLMLIIKTLTGMLAVATKPWTKQCMLSVLVRPEDQSLEPRYVSRNCLAIRILS
jgi:hypothetical protein